MTLSYPEERQAILAAAELLVRSGVLSHSLRRPKSSNWDTP